MAAERRVVLLLTFALLLAWKAFGAEEQTSHDSSSSASEEHHSDDHGASSHATSDSSHASSHGSSHAADPSVFTLGRYFDYDVFIILLSIVGGSAMVFELALSKYEQWLKNEGDTFQSTLYEKIMRELMTLGVVSFALFLFEPVVPHGTEFLIFEFAHYVIFFIAIFMVLQLITLGLSTYPIKRMWDIAAYKSKDEVLQGYRETVASMRKWSVPMPLLGRVSFDVLHRGRNWKWLESMDYHLARSIFIRKYRRSANFDFARYACLVTDRQMLNMANISLSSWLVLVVLHWALYGLKEATSRDDQRVLPETWFVFGVLLCLLELAVLSACMLGMRRICVKLGACPADPRGTLDVVVERIWVDPVTQVQHSRYVRETSMMSLPVDLVAGAEEKAVYDSGVNGASESSSAAAAAAAATAAAATHIGGGDGRGLEGGSGGDAVVVLDDDSGIPDIAATDAFVLPTCNAYKMSIEVLMLLNSYHLAVYVVYFIAPAANSSSEWFWIVLLPLPILCGVLMAYRRVLPLLALLSIIVVLHPTDVADVEQEAEETNKIRRKLVLRVEDVLQQEYQACAKIGQVGHDRATACLLIERWDANNDGTLSYEELETGLTEIGLVLSKRQRRELLRLADPDRSGSVDIKELTDLLYDVQGEVAAAAAVQLELAAEEAGGGVGGGGGNGVMDESSRSNANARVERLLLKRASSKW